MVTRQSSLQQLRTLSEAIASNSTAALAFDNPEDAIGTLDGVPIRIRTSSWRRSTSPTAPCSRPIHPRRPRRRCRRRRVPPGYGFEGSNLIGVTEVREGELVLGTLFVRSDMKAIYERLGLYALVAAIIIGLALMAAWAISRRLQKQLSRVDPVAGRNGGGGFARVTTTACVRNRPASTSSTR